MHEKMENSMRVGFMAVFAVSGSMVFLLHQLHKRLLSNFMKKMEFEMGEGHVLYSHHPHKTLVSHDQKHLQAKKRVRFAEQVLEFPMETKGYCRNVRRAKEAKHGQVLVIKDVQRWRRGPKLEDIMPPNRAVLYREIMKYRTLKGRLKYF